jgi:hypothetical protein
MSADAFRSSHLQDIVRTFRMYKSLGDRAMAQVSDADLHALLDSGSNSIAMIVKHVGGNLRSRFTDFLTTDGEKATRNRDGEFEMTDRASRDQILEWWESGWSVLLTTLDGLSPDDLDRTVHIRREPFLVVEALDRSVTHTAYHVGQIVMLAKHLARENWTALTIPKHRSGEAVAGDYKTRFTPKP